MNLGIIPCILLVAFYVGYLLYLNSRVRLEPLHHDSNEALAEAADAPLISAKQANSESPRRLKRENRSGLIGFLIAFTISCAISIWFGLVEETKPDQHTTWLIGGFGGIAVIELLVAVSYGLKKPASDIKAGLYLGMAIGTWCGCLAGLFYIGMRQL